MYKKKDNGEWWYQNNVYFSKPKSAVSSNAARLANLLLFKK